MVVGITQSFISFVTRLIEVAQDAVSAGVLAVDAHDFLFICFSRALRLVAVFPPLFSYMSLFGV